NVICFFFQAEDGIRDRNVTGVQTCALPILRAPLGPGTSRMNRVVVRRAAAGIADFALQHTTSPVIIIGYDARHYSREFAQDSAAVFTAAGCRVKLMPNTVPTPLLAF